MAVGRAVGAERRAALAGVIDRDAVAELAAARRDLTEIEERLADARRSRDAIAARLRTAEATSAVERARAAADAAAATAAAVDEVRRLDRG